MEQRFRDLWIVLLALTSTLALGQVQQDWISTFHESEDQAYCIARTSDGSVYVAGVIWNTVSLQRFDSNGNLLWTYKAPIVDPFESGAYPRALLLDENEQPIIVAQAIIIPSANKYLVIKCDESGSLTWLRLISSGLKDEVAGGAVDSKNNVFITGTSGVVTKRGFLAKLEPSMGNVSWGALFDLPNTSTEEFWSVAVDSQDRPVVGGQSSFGQSLGSALLMVRYSTQGVAQSYWKDTVFTGTEDKTKIAVDSLDRVVLMGTAADYQVSIFRFDTGNVPSLTVHQPTISTAPFQDFVIDAHGDYVVLGYFHYSPQTVAIMKYSQEGSLLWSTSFLGDANRIAVDASRSIYVHGAYHVESGPSELGVMAFDANGNSLWDATYHGTNEIGVVLGDILVTPIGEVYFAATDSETDNTYDIVVAKYVQTKRVVADALSVLSGFVVSGSLSDTWESDDEYIQLRGSAVTSRMDPPLMFEVEATAQTSSPSSLTFSVERRVNTANIGQRIELFNFISGVFETVNESITPSVDGVTVVDVVTGPEQYIDSKTLKTRARISYYPVGTVFIRSWIVYVDQIKWMIVP